MSCRGQTCFIDDVYKCSESELTCLEWVNRCHFFFFFNLFATVWIRLKCSQFVIIFLEELPKGAREKNPCTTKPSEIPSIFPPFTR